MAWASLAYISGLKRLRWHGTTHLVLVWEANCVKGCTDHGPELSLFLEQNNLVSTLSMRLNFS